MIATVLKHSMQRGNCYNLRQKSCASRGLLLSSSPEGVLELSGVSKIKEVFESLILHPRFLGGSSKPQNTSISPFPHAIHPLLAPLSHFLDLYEVALSSCLAPYSPATPFTGRLRSSSSQDTLLPLLLPPPTLGKLAPGSQIKTIVFTSGESF